MTTPQFKPAMPPGGILGQDVDKDYSDWVVGRPVKRKVAYVELVAVAANGRDTADGRKHYVTYEAVRLVPVEDAHEQDTVRFRMAELSRTRGHKPEQFVLFPVDGEDPAVERERLLRFIDEWAAEQDPTLTREDVTARWGSWHGGFYNAQLDKAEVPHLREFCMVIGALPDETETAVAPEPTGDPDEDVEPDLDAAADDPAGAAADDEPASIASAREKKAGGKSGPQFSG